MRSFVVSVIIPCFNDERWVAKAIQSALDQTYTPKEVIVIDDGSTDASLEVIKRFDPYIRWDTGAHRGACSARNRGITIAQGDYFQFLDSDDLMDPFKIESQIEVLAGSPVDSVATCAWNHFSDEGGNAAENVRPFWRCYDESVDLLVDMWLAGGFFAPHCWLVPRTLVARTGVWDESLSADQDGEFFGRILVEASHVAFVRGVSVQYRTPGPSNVSASRSPNAVESRFRAWESVEKHLLARRNDEQTRRAVLRRLRSVTYAYARHYEGLVQKAAEYESQLSVVDFDPQMPPFSRYMIGMLGIKQGLVMVRGLVKL